ncbi:MAG TPA: alpha/beta hydrolase [Myxococcales bacterium]|nr:alpha/beta hydrolase [Myxococcales bacterium]
MRAREIELIPQPGIRLGATFSLPEAPRGVVLFAHGSGSSRFSSRNRYVAGALQGQGLATVLMDLLTAAEEEEERFTRHHRFDIRLLAGRLLAAVRWVAEEAETEGLPIGLFGASTGAAAALVAAAQDPRRVAAVVSRGGRPDLAGAALPGVRAPTLLIVGGADPEVLDLNREALGALRCEKALRIVPGATHLFEEEGALEQVAALAAQWFIDHLAPAAQPGRS